MNESLSVWTLISQATIPVQMVMALLVAASVSSWVIIFQRLIVIRAAREELESFEEAFWSGEDLRAIYREISEREEGAVSPGAERIFVAGFREFTRLTQGRTGDPELVMQGVQRAMRVALMREEERLGRHLPFLATVGSTSPYVGLFGTVWGIMNSFRRLATVSQASLATVAPGISEALIATAIGLFAAIPAVIGYNRFAAGVDSLMNRYDAFADEFASILHRTLISQSDAARSNATRSDATQSNATRSDATRSDATRSNATQSNATRSNATRSNATQSNATRSNATQPGPGPKPADKG